MKSRAAGAARPPTYATESSLKSHVRRSRSAASPNEVLPGGRPDFRVNIETSCPSSVGRRVARTEEGRIRRDASPRHQSFGRAPLGPARPRLATHAGALGGCECRPGRAILGRDKPMRSRADDRRGDPEPTEEDEMSTNASPTTIAQHELEQIEARECDHGNASGLHPRPVAVALVAGTNGPRCSKRPATSR